MENKPTTTDILLDASGNPYNITDAEISAIQVLESEEKKEREKEATKYDKKRPPAWATDDKLDYSGIYTAYIKNIDETHAISLIFSPDKKRAMINRARFTGNVPASCILDLAKTKGMETLSIFEGTEKAAKDYWMVILRKMPFTKAKATK